ncbi:hypothetical protein N656DRAFT_271016 [Canariomyces notabilis]|uniref:Uncharacterized protein n=1 Tax=Canariomyces notabilis TaxID=2074819 RepID=A0AAN6YX38_9PEZI|nr:hypothetical protein N656DRAFT_271016 [Canariomyces arenarius]
MGLGGSCGAHRRLSCPAAFIRFTMNKMDTKGTVWPIPLAPVFCSIAIKDAAGRRRPAVLSHPSYRYSHRSRSSRHLSGTSQT